VKFVTTIFIRIFGLLLATGDILRVEQEAHIAIVDYFAIAVVLER